jgi:hypothetical protein
MVGAQQIVREEGDCRLQAIELADSFGTSWLKLKQSMAEYNRNGLYLLSYLVPRR